MKKIKYLTIALASILFVTGCGKKITCTLTEDGEDGAKMTEKIVMKVKDDKVVYLEEIDEIIAPKSISDSDWKEFVEMVKEDDDSTDGYEGVTLSQDINDSKHTYTAKIKIDLAKANDKAKEDFYLDKWENTKVDEIVKNYEDLDYKCNK